MHLGLHSQHIRLSEQFPFGRYCTLCCLWARMPRTPPHSAGRLRMNISATLCCDVSVMHKNREGLAGESLLLLIAWMVVIDQQNFHVVIQECTPLFPWKILKLCCKYRVESRVCCPKKQLGSSAARLRRYTIMRTRFLSKRKWKYHSTDAFPKLSFRRRVANGHIYWNASAASILQSSKAKAKKRGLPATQCGKAWHGEVALTPKKRRYLNQYKQLLFDDLALWI